MPPANTQAAAEVDFLRKYNLSLERAMKSSRWFGLSSMLLRSTRSCRTTTGQFRYSIVEECHLEGLEGGISLPLPIEFAGRCILNVACHIDAVHDIVVCLTRSNSALARDSCDHGYPAARLEVGLNGEIVLVVVLMFC